MSGDKDSLKVEEVFISAGFSPKQNCLDAHPRLPLVAFSSSNNIFLMSFELRRILSLNFGHKKLVECLRWLRVGCEEKTFLISNSAEECILWRISSESRLRPFNIVLDPKTQLIHSYGIIVNHDLAIITVATFDSSISFKILADQADDFHNCHQTSVKLKSGRIGLSSNMIKNSDQSILMAASLDNNDIVIFLIVGWDQLPLDQIQERFSVTQTHTLTGHSDWVWHLDFYKTLDYTLLATSSQDNTIRLWKIETRSAKTGDIADDKEEISLKRENFLLDNGQQLLISSESVLRGHGDRVYSVRFKGSYSPTKEYPELLSASMDKCVIIWSCDPDSGIWLEQQRLGNVGGQPAGYYGACFGAGGRTIIAYDFQGGCLMWSQDENDSWEPAFLPTGHRKPVKDVCWDPSGSYFLSCSSDQTTRLFSEVASEREKALSGVFYELARPQIHGFDLVCVECVSSVCFVSAGGEKISRAFSAPKKFVENFGRLKNISEDDLEKIFGDKETLSDGASLPSLGLSNKAIGTEIEGPSIGQGQVESLHFQPALFEEPPTETDLSQNTLWPEIYKLYYHGNEISCLAVNPSGTLLASACESNLPDYAKISIWNTREWSSIAELAKHESTVTQMAFSPDGKYLLAVSRDRTWSVFRVPEEEGNEWCLVRSVDKSTTKHSRVVWTCAWSHDSKWFFTGSRDKKLIAWEWEFSSSNEKTINMQMDSPVRALTLAPGFFHDERYLIACGLESGFLVFLSLEKRSISEITRVQGHSLPINRLRFRPNGQAERNYKVVTCGEDNVIKIYKLNF